MRRCVYVFVGLRFGCVMSSLFACLHVRGFGCVMSSLFAYSRVRGFGCVIPSLFVCAL